MKGYQAKVAAFVAIATMTATAAGFTSLPAGAATSATDVSVDWKVTGDWGTGFEEQRASLTTPIGPSALGV